MKIKKIFGYGALATIAAVGLASCGDVEDKSKVVDFYTTAGDEYMVALNQAKATFESQNEGWKVNITNGFSFDTLKTKCTQCLSSNTQPSLAYCYPDHVANYLKTGKVVNLKDLIDDSEIGYSAEEWSDFVSSYMSEGESYEVEGIYSIPMTRSTEIMYYNKTVFDNLHLSVPTTWDELWAVCATLKEKYPLSTPLGYDSEANWVITYLEQYAAENGGKYYTDASKPGKDKILFNNDVTKGLFNNLKTQFTNKYFTTQTVSGAYTSKLFTKYLDDAKTDDAAYAKKYTGSFISIGSTGGANKQDSDKFEVGIAAVPSITTAHPKCISQGPSIVMFNQGDDAKVKKTWEFVKVLLSPQIQAAYCGGGYSPIRTSAFTQPALIETMEDGSLAGKVTAFTQELAAKNMFYVSDAFNGSATARTQIGAALVSALKGSAADKVIADAAEEARYYTK